MKQLSKIFIIFSVFILISPSFMVSKDNKIIENEPILETSENNVVEEHIIDTSMHIERFRFPLPEQYKYCISSIQGLRDSFNTKDSATLSIYHNAIDFAVPIRTSVYAAKSGYVITCYPGYDNGSQWKGHQTYGGLIEIQHFDGTRTMYAHLIRTDVKESSFVEQGQLIGASGGKGGMRASGVSTGPHLHFAIYLNILDSFED